MPQVTMPDGQVVEMPDNPTAAQLGQLRRLQSSGIWDTVVDTAKDLGRGALRGVAGLLEAGAGQQTTGFIAKELGLPKYMQETAPLTEGVNEALPPTGPGGYRRAAAEGLGGALTTGPRSLINAAAGVGGGLGSEFGGQQFGTAGQVAGGVLGGLTAGSGAAVAGRNRPQTADLAREAQRGLTPEQLRVAQTYQQQMAAQGKPIDLVQALAAQDVPAPELGSIRNLLASHGEGAKVKGVLRNQPEQLRTEADLTVAGLPGTNYNLEQNANIVQETATKRMKQATDARSEAVRGLYAKAGDLAPEARQDLSRIIQTEISKPGATEVMIERGKDMLRKLAGQDAATLKSVTEARTAFDAATTPSARAAARENLALANRAAMVKAESPLKALDVDTWISELRGPWQGQPLKVAYPKEQGQIKGLAGQLNKRFQDLSPEVKAAEGTFRRITEEEINPLKQGVIGRLTQPRQYDPATQAMVSKFDGLMSAGTDPTAKLSEIRSAARELGKVDPEAFQGAFKGWLSREIQDASKAGGAGQVLGTTDPAKLDSLFSNVRKWQGIKDAASVMAVQSGKKPEELVRGLENLRQYTKAVMSTSKSQGISPEEVTRLGGSSLSGDVMRFTNAFGKGGRIGNAIDRMTLAKTLSQFDEILTSPKGADMLIELGKVPVMSRKAQVILGTWGGMQGISPGLSDNNPPE